MASRAQFHFLTLMWRHFIELIKNPVILITQIIIPYMIMVSSIFATSIQRDSFPKTVQHAGFGLIVNPLEYWIDPNELNEIPEGNESHTFDRIRSFTLELAYAPNDSFTRKVFREVVAEYNSSVKVTGFPDEKSARSYVKNNRLASLILLNRNDKNFNITIQNHGNISIMKKSGDWSPTFTFKTDDQFDEFGSFLSLEAVLTSAILHEDVRTWGNETREKFIQNWKLASFPSWEIVSYTSGTIFYLFYFTLVIGSIPIGSNFARVLVEEKESGVKDYMKVAGLSEVMYLFTWMLRLAILQYPLNLLLVVTYQFIRPIFISSNSFLIFVLLNLHHICFGSYSAMVSSFFSNPTLASVTTTVSWLLLTITTFILGENSNSLVNVFLMIFSGKCFIGAYKSLIQLDSLNLGLTWSNLLHRAHPTLLPPIVYMLVISIEIFLYAAIAWYICNIKPGKFGIRKHPLFCFKPSKKLRDENVMDDMLWSIPAKYPEFIEDEQPNQVATIKIVNLVKNYKSFKAVKGINLKVYKNEILILLGHNGAGKTTVMSVMTGMIAPTNGTVIIDGYDVRKDIDLVRQNLGYCPQHNIFFKNMTVKEHLLFFAALKKTPKANIAASVSRMLRISGLLDKTRTKSKNLSGGMKRRLSISIAFVGGSKVVILDEPTSGVDPAFRRLIWNIIQAEVSRTTILLSTHFMDEADYLGHRIAIMGKGEIYCCGTPMFLKSVFQVGYHLTLVKGDDFDAESTLQLIQYVIPSATVGEQTNTEFEIILPQDQKSNFPYMFKMLEAETDNLGILNTGITYSGIEDVFLMVDQLIDQSSDRPSKKASPTLKNVFHEKPTALWIQLIAVLKKKCYYLYYNKKLLIFQVVLPWLIAGVALLNTDTDKGTKTKSWIEQLPLNLDMYKHVEKILLYDENHSQEADIFRNILKKENYLDRLEVCDEPISELLMDTAKNDHNNFPRTAVFGVDINKTGTTFYYNQEAHYAGAVSGTYLLTTYFQSITKKAISFNMEFVSSDSRHITFDQILSGMDILKPIVVGFALSSLAASFLFLPVTEQITKFKHLQLLSGLQMKMYWSGSFLFDLLNFWIVIIPIIILYCYKVFKESIFLSPLLILTSVYIPSQLLAIYWLSFTYDSVSAAFSQVYLSYAIGSMILLALREMLEVAMFGDGIYFYDFLCTYFPLYNLEVGLVKLYNCHTTFCFKEADPCCVKGDYSKSDSIPCPVECSQTERECRKFRAIYGFETPGIGPQLLIFSIWIVLGTFRLYLLENPKSANKFRKIGYYCPLFWCSPCMGPCCFCCPPLRKLFKKREKITQIVRSPGPDDDVIKEKERILNRETESDIVVIDRLVKEFGQLTAVKEICLGIPIKECFGLLGVNGAGKTTTFRMLIGEESITRGDAILHGHSIRTDITSVNRYIGYCPQFGGVISEFPADKLLAHIAMLRGHKNFNEIATMMAQRLGFEEHAKKPIINMSGGNQRKVNTAVALIGSPPILFMDEPTTGMDPGVKRKIWSALSEARDQGSCIILTTHSMEECEALCTRLAIMVSGEFCCLGSPQHLKDKYAQGYMVVMKLLKMDRLKSQQVQLDIVEALNSHFPGCSIKQSGVEAFNVSIPGRWPWHLLFSTLETIAENPKFYVDEYQLIQATLDDIFLEFTALNENL